MDDVGSDRVFELAGSATLVAAVALVLSGVALALFFGGAGGVFGPINDVLFAAAMALLVPAILAVRRIAAGRIGAWFDLVSLLAIVGIAILVVGQLLLVSGVISLVASFATVGIGFLGFMLWAGGVAALALRTDTLSSTVGWWAIAFVVALLVATAGWFLLPLAAWSVLGLALLVTLVGWLVSLGVALRRRAAGSAATR